MTQLYNQIFIFFALLAGICFCPALSAAVVYVYNAESASMVVGGSYPMVLEATETFYIYEGGTGATPEVAGSGAWDISALATAGNWASVTEDDGKIGPGDTVYLMDDGGNHTGILYVLSSGTSGNPITLAAYPGDSPVVTGDTYGLNITGQSYANVSDIVFQNATTSCGRISSSATADASYIYINDCQFNSANNHGLIIDSPSSYVGYYPHHIYVTDTSADDNGENGFSTEGTWGTSYVTYTRCTADGNNLDQLDRQGFSTHTSYNDYTSGWTLSSGTVYYRSETNEPYKIYHRQGPTIPTEDDGDTTSVASGEWDWDNGVLYINIGEDPAGDDMQVFYAATNHITYSHCSSTNNNESSEGYDGSGFTLDFGTEDCVIAYPTATGNDGHGISCILSLRPEVYGGVIRDNGQGTGNAFGIRANRKTLDADFHDNTLDGHAYGIGSTDGSEATIRNNLIMAATLYGIGDDGTGSSTEDYNHKYNCGNSNANLNVSVGANSQTGDPGCVNYAGNDFDLDTGSACINQGTSATGYTEDYDGDAINGTIDIGAYEY